MSWIRWSALALAVIALLLLTFSGPFVRFGVWSLGAGFTVLRWSAYLAIAAVLLAVVALAIPKARARGIALPAIALLVGLGVFYVPFQWYRTARALPPINDITTDTENPPRYMTGPRAYPGAEVARQQRAAYSDIAPLLLPVSPREAFAKAVVAAEAMSWEVVGRDAAAGTLEAVDTTKWFGFKDDIAVRVTAANGGSRIDVRSKSRVGRGDVGTNARRIRAYLQQLK